MTNERCISIPEAIEVIKLCYETKGNGRLGKIVPYFAGHSGFAKTDAGHLAAEELGINCIVRQFGAFADLGDLLGYPIIDEKTKTMTYAPPHWWPTDPNWKGILFLDEVNRANNLIRQSLIELMLNYSIAGRKLPEGALIVSAGNFSEEYDTADLDPALENRLMMFVIDTEPTPYREFFANTEPALARALDNVLRNHGAWRTDTGEQHVFGVNRPVSARGLSQSWRFLKESGIDSSNRSLAKKCINGILKNWNAAEAVVATYFSEASEILRKCVDGDLWILHSKIGEFGLTEWTEVLENLRTSRPADMSSETAKRVALFLGTLSPELEKISNTFIASVSKTAVRKRKRKVRR
jgi:hypothetical protein